MSGVGFKKLSREMSGQVGFGSSLVLFVVIALVACLLVWSNYAELDNVTRGEGRIVSSMQNQSVQAGEGGILLRRYVSENSIVKKGELLFEIDPIDAASELNQMSKRTAGLDIRKLRLQAEIANETNFQVLASLVALSPSVALSEESLFAARRLELSGRVNVLEHRLAQSEQDVIASRANADSALRTMNLLEEEIAVVEPLVEENIAPATQLLKLQREREQAIGIRQTALVNINQAELAIMETRSEIENIRDAYVLSAIDERAKVVSQLAELSEALPRLEDRVSRTLIRAPMDGIVNTLNFRTAGGYIRTGDVVLELVPTGEALIVETKIKPQDISRVNPDDEVKIRLSAYDSSKHGHVLGRVASISADAVIDERSGTASHYLINVEIEGEMIIEGKAVELLPGMTATVDVLSGKKTVFEYIWQPIAKVNELALRD